MDTLSNNSVMNSVQQRAPTKRSKNKKRNNNNNNSNNKKHIKVVYISNPMKVKTSASEFRALVQELTGQDSELPPDPSKFQGSDGDGGSSDGGNNINNQVDSDNFVVKVGHDIEDDDHDTVVVVPPPLVDPSSNINCEGQQLGGGGGGGGGGCSMENFEPFDDDVFTPQMIENISSLLPSSVFYESPQADQVVMQCNYVHP